jgi:hypothetical protein
MKSPKEALVQQLGESFATSLEENLVVLDLFLQEQLETEYARLQFLEGFESYLSRLQPWRQTACRAQLVHLLQHLGLVESTGSPCLLRYSRLHQM